MLLAQKVSKGSDDNSTKVGAVIIKNNKIVATGFNH
jgi:deoxycytidylate deaminase